MDQALKQRLVGAVVITALAAIFVPMFFEDSVDDSRREVSRNDLAIPAAPQQEFNQDNPIPAAPRQVLHAPASEAESAAPAGQQDIAGEQGETAETQSVQEEPAGTPVDVTEEAVEEALPEAPVAAAHPVKQTHSVAVAAKKPAPSPKPAAQAAPQNPPAPSAKAAELQRWVVQLGSFSKKENADSLVGKLRAQGFNAYGDTIEVAGKGTMFRVRIGPELDKKRAQATQKRLQQLDSMSSIVLSE